MAIVEHLSVKQTTLYIHQVHLAMHNYRPLLLLPVFVVIFTKQMNTVTHVQVQFHYHNFCHQSLHFRCQTNPSHHRQLAFTDCFYQISYLYCFLKVFFLLFSVLIPRGQLSVFKCTLNTHISHHTNILVYIKSYVTQLSMQTTLSSRNL